MLDEQSEVPLPPLENYPNPGCAVLGCFMGLVALYFAVKGLHMVFEGWSF